MICPCTDVMEEKLKELGIKDIAFRDQSIDTETGEANMLIIIVGKAEVLPEVWERHSMGIVANYCPFCGKYLGKGEEYGTD